MRIWLAVAVMSFAAPSFVLFAAAQDAGVTGGAATVRGGVAGAPDPAGGSGAHRSARTSHRHGADTPKQPAGGAAGKTRPAADAATAKAATKDPAFQVRNAVIPP